MSKDTLKAIGIILISIAIFFIFKVFIPRLKQYTKEGDRLKFWLVLISLALCVISAISIAGALSGALPFVFIFFAFPFFGGSKFFDFLSKKHSDKDKRDPLDFYRDV